MFIPMFPFGCGGEGFPYTNFHNMNMDWVIKIVKDFLDQYTHIQSLISEGVLSLNSATEEGITALTNKGEQIETLLNTWYETHSEDIANELTNAISEFTEQATRIAQNTISSIPQDYSTFYSGAYKNLFLAGENFDLNSVNINAVHQIDGNTNPQHYPSDMGTKSAILITNLFVSNASIRSQMLIGFSIPAVFIRRYSNNTWSEWQSLNSYVFGTLNQNSDLNNISTHSTYVILSGAIPSNYPPDLANNAGYVTTIPFYGQDYLFQICTGYTYGVQYFRIKRNGAWTEWGTFPGGSISNYGGTINTNRNIDTLPFNSIYSVASGANYPEHYPLNSAGFILTIKYAPNFGLQFVFPLFIASGGIDNFQKLNTYIRYTNSYPSWSDWFEYRNARRSSTSNYIAFGDSIVYGYSADHSHAQSIYNYPTLTANLTGVRVNNQAVPAQGLLKDWESILSNIETLDFTNVDLITVGWSYNDSTVIPNVNFGNPTDPIPNSTDNITTWLGYYAKVLSILQNKAPNAQIILITGYGQPSGTDPDHLLDDQFTYVRTFRDGNKTIKQMYDALEEMANHYGFNCINQSKGTVINKFNCASIIGDNIHPTYDGYKIYGDFISSKIASMYNNQK